MTLGIAGTARRVCGARRMPLRHGSASGPPPASVGPSRQGSAGGRGWRIARFRGTHLDGSPSRRLRVDSAADCCQICCRLWGERCKCQRFRHLRNPAADLKSARRPLNCSHKTLIHQALTDNHRDVVSPDCPSGCPDSLRIHDDVKRLLVNLECMPESERNRLLIVIRGWQGLSESVQAGIVAMVEAVRASE